MTVLSVDYVPSRGPRSTDLPIKNDNYDRMYGSLPHNLGKGYDQSLDRRPQSPYDRHAAKSPYDRSKSPYGDPRYKKLHFFMVNIGS